METSIASAGVLAAEVSASGIASASCYCCPENVGIVAIVVAELKLIQIQRQVFLAYVVIRADDSSLKKRPKILNVVGVNNAAHVFATAMTDSFVREILPAVEVSVARVFVCRDQFDFPANRLGNESAHRHYVGTFDHFADHVTLARDRADYWRLI